jgi:thiosulfate/3-mercaptopyruvate sulfurtransferase
MHRLHAFCAAVLVSSLLIADGALAEWPLPWLREKKRDVHFPDLIVTASWVAQRDNDAVVLLDARPRDVYDAGHIPGALSLPARDLTDPARVATELGLAGLTGREMCVCYADRQSISSAAYLFWLLAFAGHDRVRILDGGIEAWRKEDRPLSRAPSVRTPATWATPADSSVFAALEYVRDHYGRPKPGLPDFEILDARSEEEWSGRAPVTRETAAHFPRSGHIPHSLPFDFSSVVQEDGRFPNPEDLRATLSKIGPRPASPVNLDAEFIVTDDGASREGALGFVLLRIAGFERVRYFPGGWREWSADPSLPVVRILTAPETREALAIPGKSAAIVFDLRHDGEFNAGHIPGSFLLSSHEFGDSLEAHLSRHRPGVDRRSAMLIGYCYGSDCIRSRNCTTLAAQHGFLRLGWFRGGMPEWKSAGYPVQKKKPAQVADKSWLDRLRKK